MNEQLYIEDGFIQVVRKNNPLRKTGLVHCHLGKIGSVRPQSAVEIIFKMLRHGIKFGNGPVIGLSESSILLGRLASEFVTHNPFIFSTRYPVRGMIGFVEPHSHARHHYLNVDAIKDADEILIVEDEITSGNTILGLIECLLENMQYLKIIRVVALKAFCSPGRVRQMKDIVAKKGARLYLSSLFGGTIDDEEPLISQLNSDSNENLPVYYSFLEAGRGRIELFVNPESRYAFWDNKLPEISEAVTVIGVSEAIDVAFEISNALDQRGIESSFRQLTMSPWMLPGWVFPGLCPLHLYYPTDEDRRYIIVYDNPTHRNQVNQLYDRLITNGAQIDIIGPDVDLYE